MSTTPSIEAKRASTSVMSQFIVTATPPAGARERAAVALCDTFGVVLAGSVEPSASMIRSLAGEEGSGAHHILGVSQTAGAGNAALANGVAAHALDYDDMCFVSMAHPSCALVPAALAAAELIDGSGPAVLDAYVVGFEVECRLGMVMN